jgi:dihydropyrimidinase
MQYDKVISNGMVVTPQGVIRGDVGISGEQIAAVGGQLDGTQIIDANGHYVIPGVLDVHVHLELPFCGTVSADDYHTGTRAAARGGVTTEALGGPFYRTGDVAYRDEDGYFWYVGRSQNR